MHFFSLSDVLLLFKVFRICINSSHQTYGLYPISFISKSRYTNVYALNQSQQNIEILAGQELNLSLRKISEEICLAYSDNVMMLKKAEKSDITSGFI